MNFGACLGWLLAMAGFGCGTLNLPVAPYTYHGRPEAYSDVPPAHRNNLVPILYATDREPVLEAGAPLSYGSARSNSLAYGEAVIRIGPDNLPWETLVAESINPERKDLLPLTLTGVRELGRFPETPSPAVQGPGGAWTRPDNFPAEQEAAKGLHRYLSGRLAGCRRKEALVFVHGFANDFEYPARVVSCLWHYLGRDGIPVIYSWPAGHGGLTGYLYDRESGEFTIYHLKQFLRHLAATPGLERIHFVAHSRGTDVLLTALRELHIEWGRDPARTCRELKIDTLILAAPDLDTEVVSQRMIAEHIPLIPRRIVLYSATSDRALGLASWLFDSVMRLGELISNAFKPAQVDAMARHPELQIIQCKVKGFASTHSYFHSHPAVVSDIIQVLRYHKDPGAEFGRPLKREPGGFWILPNEYLKPAGTP